MVPITSQLSPNFFCCCCVFSRESIFRKRSCVWKEWVAEVYPFLDVLITWWWWCWNHSSERTKWVFLITTENLSFSRCFQTLVTSRAKLFGVSSREKRLLSHWRKTYFFPPLALTLTCSARYDSRGRSIQSWIHQGRRSQVRKHCWPWSFLKAAKSEIWDRPTRKFCFKFYAKSW